LTPLAHVKAGCESGCPRGSDTKLPLRKKLELGNGTANRRVDPIESATKEDMPSVRFLYESSSFPAPSLPLADLPEPPIVQFAFTDAQRERKAGYMKAPDEP
jgi:hypothetical protein